MRGLNISDNILTSQEIMLDLVKAPKTSSLMAIKMDMEFTYDHV